MDKNSAEYGDGLEIDYFDDLINLGFKFLNPTACNTCGCGANLSTLIVANHNQDVSWSW